MPSGPWSSLAVWGFCVGRKKCGRRAGPKAQPRDYNTGARLRSDRIGITSDLVFAARQPLMKVGADLWWAIVKYECRYLRNEVAASARREVPKGNELAQLDTTEAQGL